MDPSDDITRTFARRLLLSRMRILLNNGFYGLLLMHMTFALDTTCDTAFTDGRRIAFNPNFLAGLSDIELDYVMMHEILHAALRHCWRRTGTDQELFDAACDIVVDSNILKSCGMNELSITLGGKVAAHLVPDRSEGYEHTAEEVYGMLLSTQALRRSGNAKSSSGHEKTKNDTDDIGSSIAGSETSIGESRPRTSHPTERDTRWDNHTRWAKAADSDASDTDLPDEWKARIRDACEAISVRDPSNRHGLLPAFAERMLGELREGRVDWRTILAEFVQEEIVDYSFVPPDRRFGDSDFFLPDFNDREERAEDILFMIDTSGSISDDAMTNAYSEVKGAIDQFDGKLRGWLGFFDAEVIEPRPFSDADEFRAIKPAGGGGTSFRAVFDYVGTRMLDEQPASIIILTDGYAPFPSESAARGIPVLWLLCNNRSTPPWGKIARMP